MAVIDGTATTQQQIVGLVRDRLPMMPRWQQKVHTVPLDEQPARLLECPGDHAGLVHRELGQIAQ